MIDTSEERYVFERLSGLLKCKWDFHYPDTKDIFARVETYKEWKVRKEKE